MDYNSLARTFVQRCELVNVLPKKVFGNEDNTFLKERYRMLQEYRLGLLKIYGIVNAIAIAQFFEIPSDLLGDF